MKCPHCTAENSADSRFCKKCASPLPPSPDTSPSRTATLPPQVQELAVGSLFAGRYRVLEEIGKGGMGRVYKVLDTKINETLALKLLNPVIAADGRMIERFKNELISARQISHRNVCRMYDLNEAEGTPFISMEYVGGEDLKSTIRRVGPLAIGKAILIARQICEGLAEAHRLGVIHRDLKPQNIMLDKDGVAHIMDFGIARSVRRQGLTGQGAIIGTPEYMSPEQVDGQEADARADLYALGIVLFEMVTGRMPFEGDSSFAVAYKQKSESPPDPAGLNPLVPGDLARLILRCLEKSKERRYQQAEDLLADLAEIERRSAAREIRPSKRKPAASKLVPARGGGRRFLLPAAIIAAGAGLLVTALLRIGKFVPKPSPAPQFRQVTFSGSAQLPAISPDGKFLAYVESAGAASSKVMVRDLAGGGSPLEVFQGRRCDFLRWLPNGAELSIIASDASNRTALLLVPRLGGAARPVERRPGVINVSWSPDGSHYACPDGANILVIDRASGAAKTVPIKGPHVRILDLDWSSVGDRLAYTTLNDKREYGLGTVQTDGGRQQNLVSGQSRMESPRWSPQGDAVYYLQGTDQSADVWKIAVSPKTGAAAGPASIALSGLQTNLSFTITSDGEALAYKRIFQTGHLWRAEEAASGQGRAGRASALTSGTSVHQFPSVSPDGGQVAFVTIAGKAAELFVMPFDGGSPRQLTFQNSINYGPAWSPDGREIAFISMEGGSARIWKVGSRGENPVPLAAGEVGGYSLAWNPGNRILYQTIGNRNIGMIDPVSGQVDLLIREDEGGFLFNPRFSPDGKRIGVYWNISPSRGIWTISRQNGERKFLHPGPHLPVGWSPDGRWIYAANRLDRALEIIAVDAETGSSKPVLDVPVDPGEGVPNHFFVGMAPDGKRFVFSVGKSLTDIWLVENFDAVAR